MFEPENELEEIMQQAAREPAKIAEFYKVLLQSEIYILTPETVMTPGRRRSMKFEEKINVASVDFQGFKWHPAFTAKSRIGAYVKEPETCLGAVAKNLFTMLPDSNFWFNPSSECQKPMPSDEVKLILGSVNKS